MEMRSAGPSGRPNLADHFPLTNHLTLLNQQFGAMQEGTVEAHAMVDHQQMALESERILGSEHNHAIGRCDKGGAGGHRNVETAMIAARGAIIDTLGTETTGNASFQWPYKSLPPAIAGNLDGACCVYTGKFRSTPRLEFGAGLCPSQWIGIHMLDIPIAGPDRYIAFEAAAIGELRDEAGTVFGIAIEPDQEKSVCCQRDGVAIENNPDCICWRAPDNGRALHRLTRKPEIAARIFRIRALRNGCCRLR